MESYIWLALLVIFLIAEAATVAMVSLWFAAGALVALVAGLLGTNLSVQAVLFLAVSAVLLASLRPVVRKLFARGLTPTNLDAILGTQGYVISDIDNDRAVGCVKLGGMEWSARSESGAQIPAGTHIRVNRIEGVKVFVETVEVPTTK